MEKLVLFAYEREIFTIFNTECFIEERLFDRWFTQKRLLRIEPLPVYVFSII